MKVMKALYLLFVVCLTMISIGCATVNMSMTSLEIPESSRRPIQPSENVIGNVSVSFESVFSYKGSADQQRISQETYQFEMFVYEQSYEKLLAEARRLYSGDIDIRGISWKALRVDNRTAVSFGNVNMTQTQNIRAYGTVISVDY